MSFQKGVNVFQVRQARPRQERSVVRSIDGSLPVFQYGAPSQIACAEDLPLVTRRRSLSEARRFFVTIDYLHPARRLEREGNQSTFRFSGKSYAAIELLTNSNSIVRRRAGRNIKCWKEYNRVLENCNSP